MDILSNNKCDDEDVTSGGQETIVAPSLDEAGALSRGTMLTDRWRALNADLFDMKLKVKINDTNRTNTVNSRVGYLHNKTIQDSNLSNEGRKSSKLKEPRFVKSNLPKKSEA